jgi:glutaredoxin 3
VPRVVLYGTPYCSYCLRARLLLEQKGVAFEDVDVSRDMDRRRWLLERTGRRTVPQIFIDEKPVGGYDDIALLDRQGKLDELLSRQR